MSDAGVIMSAIVGYFNVVFGVLDRVNIFGSFTLVDIGLTFLACDIILYAVFHYINHPYERSPEPDSQARRYDARDPSWRSTLDMRGKDVRSPRDNSNWWRRY